MKFLGGNKWPHPRDLNFYIVIYREILKIFFFSRTALTNGPLFSMVHP